MMWAGIEARVDLIRVARPAGDSFTLSIAQFGADFHFKISEPVNSMGVLENHTSILAYSPSTLFFFNANVAPSTYKRRIRLPPQSFLPIL